MAAHAKRFTAPDRVIIRDSSGGLEEVGTIKNISEGAVQVILSQLVEPSSKVIVAFSDDCARQGTLAYCNRQGEQYCAAIYFTGEPSRPVRSEPRYAVQNETAIVSLMDGSAPQFMARVADLSRSGIGLIVRRRLAQDDWVKVVMKTAILFGEVRHCSSEGDGEYRVGLAVETAVVRSNDDAHVDSAKTAGGLLSSLRHACRSII